MRLGPKRQIAQTLGCHPQQLAWTPLSGGCINQAARIRYPGGDVFAKWREPPLPGHFAAEAAGLRALAAARSGFIIPTVMAASDDPAGAYLLLEYLPSGQRVADFDSQLGRGLAALHRCSDSRGFGFPVDGWCGASPQPNGWQADWARFYAEQRLAHQLSLCSERGLPVRTARLIESLIRALPEHLADPEPSALIHGDLWSGNLHVNRAGQPALIDPAAYFAHREAELGMMVLFGGFSATVFAAYHEAYPLQPDWRERLPIYTLYHVLNHFALFGGAYAEQAHHILEGILGSAVSHRRERSTVQ